MIGRSVLKGKQILDIQNKNIVVANQDVLVAIREGEGVI